MIDIESEIRSTLSATAHATAIPDFPGTDALRTARMRRSRRRLKLAAVATCLVVGSGAGVAAAAGVFSNPPPSGPFAYGMPGTARTVLQAQGPGGSTLTLRAADSRLGGICLRLSGIPGGFTAGTCGRAGTSFGHLDPLWESYDARTVGLGPVVFAATVPGATRVELSFDDGTRTPLAVAHNYTIGSFTDAQSLEHPELVGYDANGAVIGRTDLVDVARSRGLTCRRHC